LVRRASGALRPPIQRCRVGHGRQPQAGRGM